MNNNKTAGSESFFESMENVIEKQIKSYSFEQLSDIIYAYGVRNSGSQKIKDLYLENIKNHLKNGISNYKTLANIAYYLLFNDIKDKELWQDLLNCYEKIPERLPIHYYKPFRLAAFYLEKVIPDLELVHLKDRFFDPEQVYDVNKLETVLKELPEYKNIMNIINNRLFLAPLQFYCFDNALMLHVAFINRKIGINFYLDRDMIPKTNKISQLRLLDSKIFKLLGWEILDISYNDYFNIGDQAQRDKFIHEWYTKSSLSQEQNKVFKINPKFV